MKKLSLLAKHLDEFLFRKLLDYAVISRWTLEPPPPSEQKNFVFITIYERAIMLILH